MTAIIDAHHHIWRRADLPWLDGPMQPRIFGPYEAIRRDYPISEYLSDHRRLRRHRIGLRAGQLGEGHISRTKSPTCSTPPTRPVFRKAIVGYADFLVDDVRPQLDRLTKYRGMRGLRMQLQWHENPQYRFAAGPDLARDPTVAEERRRGSPITAGHSIFRCSPDRCRAPPSLPPALPRSRSSSSTLACWKTCRRRDGQRWRTGCVASPPARTWSRKLSGLGTFIHKNDPDHIAAIVRETSRYSVRHVACSARISRSRNCGPGTPT